jgi:Transposase DDE domain
MAERVLMFLFPILGMLSEGISRILFKTYILGLIQENRYFSVLGLSRKTSIRSEKLYEILQAKIGWEKILYWFAKSMMEKGDWYLIVDATPLTQEHADYRVTKTDFVNIEEMKNVPQNQMISLILTNGKVEYVLDFRIWISPKVADAKDYRKQTDLALDLMKRCILMQLPVRKILFDNFFASKGIITWLNDNIFQWTTRLKGNRIVYQAGEAKKIEDFNLQPGQAITAELKGIPGKVKIVCMAYQDEIVYAATNQCELDEEAIAQVYRLRWHIETFHRQAKQDVGLEYLWMRNYRALKKSCRLCLSGLLYPVCTTGQAAHDNRPTQKDYSGSALLNP